MHPGLYYTNEMGVGGKAYLIERSFNNFLYFSIPENILSIHSIVSAVLDLQTHQQGNSVQVRQGFLKVFAFFGGGNRVQFC